MTHININKKTVLRNVLITVFTILAFAGFFMVAGTAGTIDRSPAEQLPEAQFLLQCVIGMAVFAVGAFGLRHFYPDN